MKVCVEHSYPVVQPISYLLWGCQDQGVQNPIWPKLLQQKFNGNIWYLNV